MQRVREFLGVNKHVEMLFSRCIDESEASVLASDRENHHGQMGDFRPDLIGVNESASHFLCKFVHPSHPSLCPIDNKENRKIGK